MPCLALVLLFGLVGAGCGPKVCPYCPPGTIPADPTQSCSICVKPDGGLMARGDARDADTHETDLSTEAPEEAGEETGAEAGEGDVDGDADVTSQ